MSSSRTTPTRNERPSALRAARGEPALTRPDPADPLAARRIGAGGGAVLPATCGTRHRHESEWRARLPGWSDPAQFQSREAGTLARCPGPDLPSAERRSVRALAERAGGRLVSAAHSLTGTLARLAHSRYVRGTAILPSAP